VHNYKPAILFRDQGRFLRLDVNQRLAALKAWNNPVWWPIVLLVAAAVLLVWLARRQLRKRERMNARGELLPS
jgi:membrane protein implicated in regulation of membrane protease activity